MCVKIPGNAEEITVVCIYLFLSFASHSLLFDLSPSHGEDSRLPWTACQPCGPAFGFHKAAKPYVLFTQLEQNSVVYES